MKFCALFNPQIAARHYSLSSSQNAGAFLYKRTRKPSFKKIAKLLLNSSASRSLHKRCEIPESTFSVPMTTNEEPFTPESTDICSHLWKILLMAVEYMLTPLQRKRDWTCQIKQEVRRVFAVSGHPHWLLKIFPQWINLSVKVCSSTGNNIAVLNVLWWNSVSNQKIWACLKIKATVLIPRIFVLLKHISQASAYIICRSNVSPTPTSL